MAESRRRRTGQRRGGRRDGVDGRDRERGDRTGGGCPAVAQPAGHGVVLGVLLRGQERRGREGHDAVGERGRQGPQLDLRRSRCRGPDPPGPVAVGQVLRHRVRAADLHRPRDLDADLRHHERQGRRGGPDRPHRYRAVPADARYQAVPRGRHARVLPAGARRLRHQGRRRGQPADRAGQADPGEHHGHQRHGELGRVDGVTTTGTCAGLTSNADHAITVKASDAAGNVSPASPALTVHTPGGGADNPYGDPNLVSMFNGTTLDGWTGHAAGAWSVVNGTIHGNGTSRGWIYYNKQQAGTFRWIFNVRQVSGNHAPTVLIWGTTNPIRDALSAIQFQPPNGGHWDYRPGHNNGGGGLFKTFPHTKIDVHQWAQCELIANQSTGLARMACCPLPSGATTCKGVEVLQFKDPTAGRVGPLAIQIHNSGIHDEYKSLWIESPVKTSPDSFITT